MGQVCSGRKTQLSWLSDFALRSCGGVGAAIGSLHATLAATANPGGVGPWPSPRPSAGRRCWSRGLRGNAQHQLHVLDGCARGALAQVVEAREEERMRVAV